MHAELSFTFYFSSTFKTLRNKHYAISFLQNNHFRKKQGRAYDYNSLNYPESRLEVIRQMEILP